MLPGAVRSDTGTLSSLRQKITLLEQQIEKQAEEIQAKVKLCPLLDLVSVPFGWLQPQECHHLLRPLLG